MDSPKTRSENLLSVIDALMKGGRISEPEIFKIAGSAIEAKQMIALLVKLKHVTREGESLIATPLIDAEPTPKQVKDLEDYVFGEKQASDFRTLMKALSKGSWHQTGIDSEQLDSKQSEKEEPDPEVVKRFAKDYLDVSEIAAKQSVRKKVEGK